MLAEMVCGGSNEWPYGVNVTPVLLGWPILFREFVFWEVEAIWLWYVCVWQRTYRPDHRIYYDWQ